MITEVQKIGHWKQLIVAICLAIFSATNAAALAGPIAVNDENYGVEGTTLTGNVGVNDSDADGDVLTFSLISAPTSGVFSLSPNGDYTYIPLPEFNGFAYAVYRVCDPFGNCATASLELALTFVNDPPFINNDNFYVTVNTSRANTVATNDYDVDVEPIFYTIYTQPTNGTVTLNYSTGAFTYTPNSNYLGTDTWTYYGCDPCGVCNVGTVTMTVIPPNDPPLAADDYEFMLEDGTVSGSVAPNDTDPNGDQLTFNIESSVTNGTFTMNSAGLFNYVPGPNFSGFQYVQYSVCDIYGNCASAELMIEVAEINDIAIAGNDTFTGNEDQQITGNVGLNDYDPDVEPLIFMVTQQVNVGAMTLATNGNVVYTPPANWSGTATARYWAIDPCGQASDVAIITFVVNAVNDAPVALSDNFSGDENTVITGTVAANDSDIEGDMLSFSVFTAPLNGALLMQSNGSFSYTPNSNYYGIDQAVYTVTDANGASANAQIVFQVISTNTNPELVDETLNMQEDGVLSGNVSLNDIPQIGLPVTYSLANGPATGSFELNANGTFTYTPVANFFGTITATYIGTDASGGSDIGLLAIVVAPVNDAPLASNDVATVLEDHILNDFVSSNDSDIEGDALTYTLITEPLLGTLLLNPNGSYSYTAYPNANGSDNFEYQVSDGNGGVDLALVEITIVPVNDAPFVFDDSYSTNEDSSVSGFLADNDFDLDGDALSYTMTILPQHGTMQFNTDGSFTYTPDFNYHGMETIPISVFDGQDGLMSTTLTIEVISINDQPLVQSENYFIAEDELLNGNLNANDSDADGDALTYTLVTDVAHGTLTLNTDGTFGYLPTLAYNGTELFVYQVSDGNGGLSNGTVNIFINSVNSAPIAGDDFFTIAEDDVLIANVGSNDSDLEMSPLTYTVITDVLHGTLLFNANGNFTYHSLTDYFGSDTFVYSVSDGIASTNATVFITVNSVNDTPVAHYDNFTFNEDELFTGDVSLNDNDADNDVLSYTIFTAPLHGVLNLNSNGAFTYLPDENYDGVDYFVYQVSDGNGGSINANVNLTISPVNDAPITTDDFYSMQEDAVLIGIVSANDSDDGTVNLVYTVVSYPSSGVLNVQTNGAFTYTPLVNFNGIVTAVISATDAGSPQLSSNSVLTIEVMSVDDPTLVQNESFTITEGETLNASVATNDSDADAESLTYSNSDVLSGGVFTFNSNGTFTFVSQIAAYGTQTFNYAVCDEQGVCANGQCTITVNHINHAPVAENDAFSGLEDNAIAGDLSTNDSDIDGDVLTFAVQSLPIHGTVEIFSDGTFVYTPDANYFGADGFKYVVTDALGLSALANVSLEISPVNDAPVATNDYSGVLINGSVSDLVSDNDIDSDGDALTFSLQSSTTLGQLVFNADGSYTYTPNADVFGEDSFGYEVCDGSGMCDQAVVFISISESNNPPVAADDSFVLSEDGELSNSVANNDSDVDGNVLQYSVLMGPQNGTLSLGLNGSFIYTPNANYFGTDSFVYNVCDIFNVCDQAVVSIFVNAINDLPVVQNDSFTTNEDVVLSGSLAQNDSDVETAVLNYAVLSGTAHGNLVLSGDGTFVYTPNANFFGTDQAQIQIADVGSPVNTTTSWLYITVVGVDDVTQVTNDNFSVAAGYTLNGNVSTNDTDADALSLNYSLIGPVQGGAMTFNANGSFVFVASQDYFGTQLIPYQVCDEDGTCANGVMTITVTPYNHEPTAMSTTLNACEGEIISIPLNSLVADADENSATLQLTALSGIGGALNFIDVSRIIVFEPQQGFTGDATLFYSVCDNGLPQLCASGVITIHYDSIVVPAILNEEVQMVSCFGGTDGSIWLETNAPGSVIVTWNDGVTGEVRSNLIAGTYNATLTTDAACSAEGQYSVTIVEPDQLSISGLLGFYDGSQAGSSDYMVTGGTEPYQYTWTNDAGEIISTDKILATALPGTYTVTIYDANGCSLSQDVDASTGVVESDLDMELLLYPNPAVNFLKVQFSAYKGGKALLRVFDARGKVVLDKICWITPGLNYNLIDVSNLSQGVYLLSVQGEEFKTDCSFVKAQ